MNWSEFFAMGGYAFYVWTSYGLAVVVLGVTALLPLCRAKNIRKQLKEYYELQDRT